MSKNYITPFNIFVTRSLIFFDCNIYRSVFLSLAYHSSLFAFFLGVNPQYFY